MSGEARRSNRYGQQFVRIARLLQEGWSGDRKPFPGDVKEVRTLSTIRLMADALLRHEGDRSEAFRFTGLAREIAPASRRGLLVDAARRTTAHTNPSLIRRLRAFAIRTGRLLTRDHTPRVRVGQPRSRHYVFGLVDNLRDDLYNQDPKRGPPVSLDGITVAEPRSAVAACAVSRTVSR